MKFRSLFRSITPSVLLASLLALCITVQFNSNTAHAEPITDFNAGKIIDDSVFYNKDTMSVSQIQTFLDRLIPNCDTWGTQPSPYYPGTRAEYAASVGWPSPPYVCINKYHENLTTGETSFEKGGGAFAGGTSAAQIIYNAAQAYGINPQVLLVLLKKESAGPLTSDTWPFKSQYKYAMGYACPDSGDNYSANCDSNKAGFYKQMDLAAWQLKYYKDHPNDYRYKIGWNDIQYSPDPSCGTKRVYVQNIATLSLYIYTPYTPNDGALAAYPGTAPCGAYGNRNFYQFFKEWFGNTFFSFSQLSKKTTLTGDYNGDGKADITLVYDYGEGRTVFWTLYANATGFAAPVVTWDSGKWNFDASKATWTAGDFNGDGKTDVTALYNYGSSWTKAWTLSANATGFAAPVVTWDSGKWNFDASKATWTTGDFNGDGKTDITALYDYGSAWTKAWTLYGNGTGFTALVVTWDSGKYNFNTDSATWVTGDFNGDGKTDVTALYDYGSAWTKAWTLYGNVSRFASPVVTWDSGKWNFDASKATWTAGDFNGDGKTDVTALYNYGSSWTKAWTLYGNGTGFVPPVVTWDSGKWNFNADSATWVTGDFNGDGKTDVTALYNYGSNQVKLWTFKGTASGFSSATVTYPQ